MGQQRRRSSGDASLAQYRRKLEVVPVDHRWKDYVLTLWDFYEAEGLACPSFAHELTKDCRIHFERVWEMMLGRHLLDCGYHVGAPDVEGHPDFRCERDGTVVWVEATTASAGTDEVLATRTRSLGEVYTVPHDNILLRWATALDAKIIKGEGYRRDGVIADDEAYVIAINDALVDAGTYGFGISCLPQVVEITMAVGPQSLGIDNESLSVTDRGYQSRVRLLNRNASPVSTARFLRPEAPGVSAVVGLGLSMVEEASLELLVSHNPFATVPLRTHAMGRHTREWVASLAKQEEGLEYWDVSEITPE